jgi:transcriptional regulator with XRE-family HTH domain
MNTLKSLRTALNLTQQDVSDAAKITLRMYQRFESGERKLSQAEARTVLKIAAALKSTVEDLLKE